MSVKNRSDGDETDKQWLRRAFYFLYFLWLGAHLTSSMLPKNKNPPAASLAATGLVIPKTRMVSSTVATVQLRGGVRFSRQPSAFSLSAAATFTTNVQLGI